MSYHYFELLATEFFTTAYQGTQTASGRNISQEVQERHVGCFSTKDASYSCIEGLFSSCRITDNIDVTAYL